MSPGEQLVDLKAISSIKIGGQARVLTLRAQADIESAAEKLVDLPVIIGGATNTLLPDECHAPLWRLIDNGEPIIIDERGEVAIWAGVSLARLIIASLEQGWGGGENFALIPGSLGGAIWNNIHGYNNDFIGNYIQNVYIWDMLKKQNLVLSATQLALNYDQSLFQHRHWLITGAKLHFSRRDKPELLRERYQQLARSKKTAGGTPKETVAYTAGEKVSHSIFGEGVIVSVKPMANDSMLEIAFDKVGTKKIMANYAKLKKL